MGRPRGSRKTRDIAVIGTLDLGSESLPWERQLLTQPFLQLVATEVANPPQAQHAEVDHDLT